jgi:Ca-activated chloride channel family protein
MLTFAHPWLALLLPLPVLVRLTLPSHRERRTSVRAPFLDQVASQLGLEASTGPVAARRTWIQTALLAVLWLLVVGALVRPQWVGEPIEKIDSARDLMLLVDLSGSMNETDFTTESGTPISRLEAVKIVLADFAEERSTDRLGLVVFGDAAFLQCPFTLDHEVFAELLNEVEVGMAGPRTMLGDALGLAVKSFDASQADQKTTILLTDGNDTGSSVPPFKAAELAAQREVTVHVIGVGDPAATGEAPLDKETLGAIADVTGGVFSTAIDRQSLDAVYQRISELEPLAYETASFRPTTELYPWPLGAFLILSLGFHLVQGARSTIGDLRREPGR